MFFTTMTNHNLFRECKSETTHLWDPSITSVKRVFKKSLSALSVFLHVCSFIKTSNSICDNFDLLVKMRKIGLRKGFGGKYVHWKLACLLQTDEQKLPHLTLCMDFQQSTLAIQRHNQLTEFELLPNSLQMVAEIYLTIWMTTFCWPFHFSTH